MLSAAEKIVKQPVFLLCPHAAKSDAWSLYLLVDENDHSKVLAAGIDELANQNSKDSSYAAVLAAQYDPKVKHSSLTTAVATDFGSKEMVVKEDDALHVSLTLRSDGIVDLMLSMRTGLFSRFIIGGEDKGRRDVILAYDTTAKSWYAEARALSDNKGVQIPEVSGKKMTGIVFPVTGTGIYKIMGVFENGDYVCLVDQE